MRRLLVFMVTSMIASSVQSLELEGQVYFAVSHNRDVQFAGRDVFLCCRSAETDSVFQDMIAKLEVVGETTKNLVPPYLGNSSRDLGVKVGAYTFAEIYITRMITNLLDFFLGNTVAKTPMDSNGNYRFTGIRPGNYYVFTAQSSPWITNDLAEHYAPSALMGELAVWIEALAVNVDSMRIDRGKNALIDLYQVSGLEYAQYQLKDLFSRYATERAIITSLVEGRAEVIREANEAEIPMVFRVQDGSCSERENVYSWADIADNFVAENRFRDEVPSPLYVSARNGLNMRAGPSTDHDVIEVANCGREVYLIDRNEGWAYILLRSTHRNSAAWVREEYLSETPVECLDTYVCHDCGNETKNSPGVFGYSMCDKCMNSVNAEALRKLKQIESGQNFTCEFCGAYASGGRGMCSTCKKALSDALGGG